MNLMDMKGAKDKRGSEKQKFKLDIHESGKKD